MQCPHLLSMCLCGLMFSSASVDAAWYSSVVKLGQVLVKNVLQHKYMVGGIVAGVACVLTYIGLGKLREREARRQKHFVIACLRALSTIVIDAQALKPDRNMMRVSICELSERRLWRPLRLRLIARSYSDDVLEVEAIDESEQKYALSLLETNDFPLVVSHYSRNARGERSKFQFDNQVNVS